MLLYGAGADYYCLWLLPCVCAGQTSQQASFWAALYATAGRFAAFHQMASVSLRTIFLG